MPHIVLGDPNQREARIGRGNSINENYLGVLVADAPDELLPGVTVDLYFRLMYWPEEQYRGVVVGATFTIREGPTVVGFGEIVEAENAAMAEPKLTIIGVYRPQISPETWQEQWNITGEDSATSEHFDKLVLIEAIAEGLETSFDMAQFGQMHLTYRNFPSHMQVGYDEALLSSDGEAVIHRAMGCVSGTGPLRFAAYLHLYDPARPILWLGGEVTGPPVVDMPVRLQLLMPYNVI